MHRRLRPMHGSRHRKVRRSWDVAGSVLLEVNTLVGPLLVTDNFDLQYTVGRIGRMSKGDE